MFFTRVLRKMLIVQLGERNVKVESRNIGASLLHHLVWADFESRPELGAPGWRSLRMLAGDAGFWSCVGMRFSSPRLWGIRRKL